MEGERSQPEREQQPQVPVFNLDALSDNQIGILNRALFDASTAQGVVAEVDALQEELAHDLGVYAERNPQRVKGIVRQSVRSAHPGDRYLAVKVASSLLDFDYTFTRDVLIFSYVNEDKDAPESDDLHSESAWHVIAGLVRERLNDEQIADFRARLEFYGQPLPE